jgi:hypothetical protein
VVPFVRPLSLKLVPVVQPTSTYGPPLVVARFTW